MGTSTARKTTQTRQAGHRSILAGRSAAERAEARAGICLRDSGITERTRTRYLSALQLLMPIIETITRIQDLDIVCEEWVEQQWECGCTLGAVGDALCGLQFYWPEAKGHLRGSWRLYKTWRKLEIPTRAPPIPSFIVQAFVRTLVDSGDYTLAFLIALGFHCYLRTGEILSLQFKDLQLGKQTGIVTIRGGKSGLRNNMDEAIAIYDRCVLELGHLVAFSPQHTHPSARIWPKSGTAFRKAFATLIAHFSIQHLELKPYSLRRGGATHDYMKKGILEPILLRGRWHSMAVARLYLEDGLVQLPSIQLAPPCHSHLLRTAQPFASMFH